MKIRSVIVFLVISLFALSCGGTALANTTQKEGDWQFNLAPFYLWGVNIDGDLSVGRITAPVSVPFGDVFDSLEAAFIVHFESVYKSQWGFLVDVNYLDLENNMNLPMNISSTVDLNMTLAEFSGFYRLQRDTHNIDFIAGLRYTKMETTISIPGGPTLADGDKDWLDPIIGARWMWQFADGWSLITRGDIGGFGVGSDFAWQALGLVEWQPWKYASILAGYRALYMDYEDGRGRDYFKFDATVHGPVIGINFKW